VIPETHLTGNREPNQPTTKHSGHIPLGHVRDPTEPPNLTEKFTCHKTGWFKDPQNRAIFHACIGIGNGKLKDHVFHCGVGTVYDEDIGVCKWP
jgi:hypothetical protein